MRRGGLIWLVAFAAFAAIGVGGALLTPMVSGPDEVAHVVKAAAVVRGDLATEPEWSENALGLRVPRTAVDVPHGYSAEALFAHVGCAAPAARGAPCAPDLPATSGPRQTSSTYVGTYQPTYYALVGAPTLVLDPSAGIRAARVLTALLTAALVASAVGASLHLGGRAATAGVLLAATPAVAYLAGVVNPSGPEVAATLALWTSLLVLGRDADAPRAVVAQAAVSAALLAALRPLGPGLVVAVVAAVALLAADRTGLRTLRARRSVRAALLAGAAVWLASAAHVLVTDASSTVMTNRAPDDASGWSRVADALGRTLADARDQVGLVDALGPGALRLPPAATSVWIVAVVGLVVAALAVGSTRDRVALAVITLGSLSVAPLAALLEPDVPWQARYALPLAIGVPVVAGAVVDRSGRLPRRASGVVVVAASALSATSAVLAHRRWTSRILHDLPDAVAGRIGAPLWDGLPDSWTWPRLLVLAGSAATVATGVLCARRSIEDLSPGPGTAR